MRDSDTDLGGPAEQFPATRGSLVRAAGSADPGLRKLAFDGLVAAYWKPVYKYLRLRWSLTNEDAKDRTQAFFTRALEKGFFDNYDSAQASFRTFLRVCVDRFAATEHRAGTRLKRGGHMTIHSLDFENADGDLSRDMIPDCAAPDDVFRREWLRSLFGLAVDDLRQLCAASGKEIHFALFECYDLDRPAGAQSLTYSQLAEKFGLPVTQVTNYLAFARRQFRQFVLQRLQATTGSPKEFEEERRQLFGGAAS